MNTLAITAPRYEPRAHAARLRAGDLACIAAKVLLPYAVMAAILLFAR